MTAESLEYILRPESLDARLVIGLTGWMDGGDVSTGTISFLRKELNAVPMASIHPTGFYIYNFPGSMEFSAMFRPNTVIEEGLVTEYAPPTNRFFWCARHRLVLFEGKEPHLDWEGFADCIFSLAETMNVTALYFLGSYAGVVPHSREPRLYSTATDSALRDEMSERGFRPSNYEGPAGLATHLLQRAATRDVRMASIVAEIPAYVQGRNPGSIEAVTLRTAEILGIEIDTEALSESSDAFRREVGKAVSARDDLTEMVQKLEAEYDKDFMDVEMGDLKVWLRDQGFEVA
jgi:predicted ATP-grasp superfamily ATP-dependent carboligase